MWQKIQHIGIMINRDFLSGLSSLVFPPVCKVCEKRLYESGEFVCRDCWESLVVADRDTLLRKKIPEHLDAVCSMYVFDENMQKIIHALKYRKYQTLGFQLGKRLGLHLAESPDYCERALLVPVPLHPVKLRERGYNQAERIAAGISSVLGIKVDSTLIYRRKNTVSQTKLDAVQRQANMAGAFFVKRIPAEAQQSWVILVDDVFTTGATMNAAAGELKAAGIPRIIGASVAVPLG